MHTAKSLKNKNKKINHIVFSYNKGNLIYIYIYISMHFGFNNQFIKVTRTRPIFQNSKKIIFFSFNIWGYDLIRKTYSGY